MSRKSSPAETVPVADHELAALFDDFSNYKRVVLAVSGGPDSIAMLVLAKRWRKLRGKGPKLIAVTVDHGLRRESAREARAVAALSETLKIEHHILRWRGIKPARGVQAAAREARYRLLMRLAEKAGASAIATAHTQDDQAETVLLRLVSGSGVSGLGGIRKDTARGKLRLLRPLLDVPKARLVAMLETAQIDYARDPSNDDPKYTRVRLRTLLRELQQEGLSAARLATLAQRMARADDALAAVAEEGAYVLRRAAAGGGFDAAGFFLYPEEIALRVLRGAIDAAGTEGPAELAKVEDLFAALKLAYDARRDLKRTLAGALVTLAGQSLNVAAAPARKTRNAKHLRKKQPA